MGQACSPSIYHPFVGQLLLIVTTLLIVTIIANNIIIVILTTLVTIFIIIDISISKLNDIEHSFQPWVCLKFQKKKGVLLKCSLALCLMTSFVKSPVLECLGTMYAYRLFNIIMGITNDHHHHRHHHHHQNNQDHLSIAHLLLIVAASTPSCKSHTHNFYLFVVTSIDP